ncbi:hypothetical protein B9T26_14780 [Acinetobacter sp. ANC 4169]|nr:hypothetical protein B9T26_14780 [Acinetobacter sp. ANC 4169]
MCPQFDPGSRHHIQKILKHCLGIFFACRFCRDTFFYMPDAIKLWKELDSKNRFEQAKKTVYPSQCEQKRNFM